MPQCYPGSDLVLLAALIAIILSDDLSSNNTGILAGLFTSIGDNLALIAIKKQLCENKDSSDHNT